MEDEPGERTPALAAPGDSSRGVRAHSSSPRRVPLFERASARWWNPQFRSPTLEAQYWKCSFSQLRDRFRAGLVYISFVAFAWVLYLAFFNKASMHTWLTAMALVAVCTGMLFFTLFSTQYQRFYMPSSFLCTFLICLVTLVIFSADSNHVFMTPVTGLVTSFQVVLLIYTVIPLPLYLCLIIGISYSFFYETLSDRAWDDQLPWVKILLHIGVHLLGIHLFILTQVRQRKTFLKVGQSLLARKDLEMETMFKDHMIQSVMPKKVADELLKDANELRRPSASQDSGCRTSNGTANMEAGTLPPMVPEHRKFRPFTMNLMTNVSILFADIAGFTKMSSNKSADELVNLLNDLFGRFDHLAKDIGLEKISTLGDCYYCVAGCPEPCEDHAKRTVEMGLEMIVAIAQFDLDRGQEVNMRVGIHTGKVMCGMVGTKRFKFDVFSNDVSLANEMESSGQAGRVHVSEATAKYLSEDYILEEGEDYTGPYRMQVQGRERRVKPNPLKTFFVKDRKMEKTQSKEEEVGSEQTLNRGSFKKVTLKQKLAGRLKMPGGRSSGSLRMKLADRNRSTQLLANKESNSICVMEDNRKSTSLQALATDNYHGSSPDTRNSYHEMATPKASTEESVSVRSNSIKGSRSSGLQDACSDINSVGGLDTAISHHHNAASLTRFDTDNKDFDQRLAMVISQGDIGFDKGFWDHHESLNKWTLRFNEKDVEEEYRAHFTGDSAENKAIQNNVIALHQETQRPAKSNSQYRYSGVFIDIVVSALLFFLASAVVFVYWQPLPITFWVYFPLSTIIVLLSIGLIGVPQLRRTTVIPCVQFWQPRHIIGAVLIALPVGVALSVMPLCIDVCPDIGLLRPRLVFSFIMTLALFAHCNFSQLGAWPKTMQCVLVGLIHIFTVYLCQQNLTNQEDSMAFCASNTTHAPKMDTASFGSPLFLPEIILDVILSVVLVGFLNYQFEAAFRMSFFGDVQARRDTERMQIVRDQADWLLNNVIPAHAVESLKNDTKYSENHESVAVVFASITNWTDMYEENFEGGREFLRVLNEIIGDFDELLDRPEHVHIEKIKTIGAAYMAASGLNPEAKRNMQHPKEHLYQMVDFALAIQHTLSVFNEDLLNFDFVMKLGLNIGPVTAGVIGTTKLYYDIWGDTVNIASRMYSTGVINRIQVSQYTRDLLLDRYDFEFRAHIEVKGVDGGMDTYLLVGRKGEVREIPPVISDHKEENANHS